MRNNTVLIFLDFTIIIVHGSHRMFLVCMRRFTQIQISVSWNVAYNHTTFETQCSVASPYILPFILQRYIYMSTVPENNITWMSSVLERLLHSIISTGAYCKKVEWGSLGFYSSMPIYIFRWAEENLSSNRIERLQPR